MEPTKTEVMDKKFISTLNMSVKNNFDRLHQAVVISNMKYWYIDSGILWPVMTANERAVFDRCCKIAREINIDR